MKRTSTIEPAYSLDAATTPFTPNTMRGPSHHIAATTLHDLVFAAAKRAPTATAVIDAQGSTTYAELCDSAELIACHLIASGVQAGDLVGICMVRSHNIIATILGVLRSGAAFIALDLAYPAERLHATIAVSGLATVVGDASGARVLDSASDLAFIDITNLMGAPSPSSTRWGATMHAPSSVPNGDPADLAYVIATSGSTGAPKCVMIEHGAAINLIEWAHACFSSEDLAEVLWSTSLAFDLSIFEIFAPLALGATVIVADSLFDLGIAAHTNSVTLVNTVPSLLGEQLNQTTLPRSVRSVCLAGETLTADLVARIHADGPYSVFNLYGPSETTTYSTAAFIAPGASDPIPIGLPISNTEILIVDEHLNPVADGEVGELLIAGAGCARGFIGERSLNDGAFIDLDGTRWFRTRDAASVRDDGQLDFLGRVDSQIKVRGLRIEPGDVETAFRSFPGIRDAVVVSVCKPAESVDELAAIYAAPNDIPNRDLRAHLALRLPSGMIPTRLVRVEATPRLPNGKVDRAAVQALIAKAPPPSFAHFEASQYTTALQNDVAVCWKTVLSLAETPGSDRDFFELGGTSLLAVRLIAHTEARFGVRLPIGTLVTHPTVAAFTSRIESTRDGAPFRSVEGSQHFRGAVSTLAPIVFIMAWPGDLFRLRRLNAKLNGQRDVFGIALHGPESTMRETTSVPALAQSAFDQLQQQGIIGRGLHLAGHSFGGLVASELSQTLKANGATSQSLTLFDTAAPPRARSRRIVRRLVAESRRRATMPISGRGFDEHLVALNDHFESATVRFRPRPIAIPTLLVRTVEADGTGASGYRQPDLGWSPHIRAPFEVVSRSGHYGTIFEDPQFEEIVRRFSVFLDAIELSIAPTS